MRTLILPSARTSSESQLNCKLFAVCSSENGTKEVQESDPTGIRVPNGEMWKGRTRNAKIDKTERGSEVCLQG